MIEFLDLLTGTMVTVNANFIISVQVAPNPQQTYIHVSGLDRPLTVGESYADVIARINPPAPARSVG